MKNLIASLVALITLGVPAASDPITIYTGKKGGGYDARAKVIEKRLEQRQFDVSIDNRAGSDDITLQSCAEDMSIWIAQIDAIYAREMKDGCYLPTLAVYGDEIAAIFFPPKSRFDELDDLGADHKIFVDKVGSGSELFFRTAVNIEAEHGNGSKWAQAEPVTGDPRRATSMAARGKIHAVILVRKPGSKDFERLLTSGWAIGELYDKDINDQEYGGASLYEGRKIRLKAGKATHKGYGYTVKSLIGTTETIENDHPDLFDAILGALE